MWVCPPNDKVTKNQMLFIIFRFNTDFGLHNISLQTCVDVKMMLHRF